MNQESITKEPISTNTDNLITYALTHGFGELHIKTDSQTGMIAIVALHSTKLGPALGGCRFIEYPNTDAAIQDAMRLAIGMSSKAALANLPIGGGKAVIIKPKTAYDRTAYLREFGCFINNLGGRYITALDSGTQLEDMDIIAEQTPYVASKSIHGDPSASTALGVFHGVEAAVLHKLQKKSLKGLHVAIQGLGHVGYRLAEHLHRAGARLTVADTNSAQVERAVSAFSASSTSTADIHTVACDVFSPCAIGGTINSVTIDQLQTSIVAGAANNQLEHTYNGQQLHDKGILYATDYLINAGGLIFATYRYLQKSEEQMNKQIELIGKRLVEVFERSQAENKPTNQICDAIAQDLLRKA